MKTIISHIDLDGYGVNVLNSLFEDVLGFDEIKNKNYGFEEEQEIKDLINKDNELVIVDLSLPEPVYDDWKSRLKSLKIIDHHESSRYLTKDSTNIWSTDYSGTALFWIYEVKSKLVSQGRRWDPKIEYFVKLVDCYDRWQEDSEYWLNATRLNKVNQMLGDRFVSSMVKKLTTLWEWTSEEEQAFIEVEALEDQMVSDIENELSIKTDNSGFNFAFVEILDKSKLSMVCSKLLNKYPEIDYVIGYNPRTYKMSFRSKKDYIDLTKIHGVFGHVHAAGSECDAKDFYKLLLEDYCVSWVGNNMRKSQGLIVEKIDS